MNKIIVASKNPVKINAAKQAFEKMFKHESFEISGVSVQSGVSNQPITDEETYAGAMNRVNNAKSLNGDVEYWVGIEGGLEENNGEFEVFAWVVVCSKDDRHGKGRTSTFILPKKVAALVRQGKELGHATDAVFKVANSKHKQGTIGLLTDSNIDRTKYYVEAIINALIPFKNPELYF